MAAFMRHVQPCRHLFQRFPGLKTPWKIQELHTHCSRPVLAVLQPSFSRDATKLKLRDLSRRSAIVVAAAPVRWNSDAASSQSPVSTSQGLPESLSQGYIPEPPPIPVPEVPVELPLNALGEPTLEALGLAKWTPPGFVQSTLEFFHVGLDMPWWGSIVAGTIIIRLCIFPLVIMAQRNAAHMHNHMPTVTRLQEKFTKTRMTGNVLEAARAANELQDYMKRNNVRPGRSMLVPLAQMPIFISVFLGIRGMANLPVQSMTTGGLLWFRDLTVPDPYYLLPVITMSTLLTTIELGVDGVRAQTMSHTMKWGMRLMPVVLLPLVLNFPSAMLCYWMTSNSFSLVQVLFLKIPAVREFFQIPQLTEHTMESKPKSKGFVKGFRETWDNSKLMAEVEDRQRMDAVRWKESGEGALQKTYAYDPTKRRPKASIGAKSK